MSGSTDFSTTEEAARRLGVTARRVQQMLRDGDLLRVARGLDDSASLDAYVAAGVGGRTRVWAEHTAWGAIALLSDVRPDWLGASQTSRLRRALRAIIDPAELVARVSDRAVVHTYTGHPVARSRLQAEVISTYGTVLGLVDLSRGGATFGGSGRLDVGVPPDNVDGYLAGNGLESTVRSLGLINDPRGPITVRATRFDLTVVRELAHSSTPVLAALDAATSLDPRARGVGGRVLADVLADYRRS